MKPTRINEAGRRIGESHPGAVLDDADVERLLADRGTEDAPRMTYAELAKKYGVSKSCVAGIVTGRRRGQIGPSVDRPDPKRHKRPRVRVNLRISLHARAKLHRLGGGRWLEKVIEEAKV